MRLKIKQFQLLRGILRGPLKSRSLEWRGTHSSIIIIMHTHRVHWVTALAKKPPKSRRVKDVHWLSLPACSFKTHHHTFWLNIPGIDFKVSVDANSLIRSLIYSQKLFLCHAPDGLNSCIYVRTCTFTVRQGSNKKGMKPLYKISGCYWKKKLGGNTIFSKKWQFQTFNQLIKKIRQKKSHC